MNNVKAMYTGLIFQILFASACHSRYHTCVFHSFKSANITLFVTELYKLH